VGFYNVVNASSLVSGMPEDISQVLANFNAIATVLNGNVDNTNINSSAAIDQTKLALPIMGRSLGWTKGTTPPASPNDGDLWLLPADATNGVMWLFRYNAGSASAYKWEFIGGPALVAKIDTDETFAGGSVYVDALTAGPILTLTRAGDYRYEASVSVYDVSVATAQASAAISINAAGPAAPDAASGTVSGAGIAFSIGFVGQLLGRAANDTVRIRQSSNGTGTTNAHVRWRVLRISPVRVS